MIEQVPEITLQKVTEEYLRLVNVDGENVEVEEKNISSVQTIK